MFRLYENLISFIDSLLDWILIFYFMFMNTVFYSFIRSKIEFWPSATSLRTLDFIHSSASRLNFVFLLRLYKHWILCFHPLSDWMFYFDFTNTWFHSFANSTLKLCSSTSFLQTFDFINSFASSLNCDLFFQLYEHFISFITSSLQ